MENTPSLRLLNATWKLFNASRTAGLSTLIQAASEVFNAPILYTNELFQIRVMYPNHPTGDPGWDELYEQRHLPLDEIWKILDENLSGAEPFYQPFYANTGLCRDVPRLFGEVVRSKAVRGHIVVYLGDIPLQAEDLEIMDTLTELLRQKADRRAAGMDNWTQAVTTHFQLLLDLDTPRHLVTKAVNALHTALSGQYAVMVTPFGRMASQRAFADYTVMQVRERFRNNVVCLVHQEAGAIVTLLGGVKGSQQGYSARPANSALVRNLFYFFEQFDLVSGLSAVFDDVSRTHAYYRQALLSAKMALRTGGTHRAVFNDYMPRPMIAALLEHEDAETFLHPALPAMYRYDQAHNTAYFQTLYEYLMNMLDKSAAAAMLELHKNTLQYRLNRISELFGLDLNHAQTLMNLLLSFLLWDLTHTPEKE